jgi:tetratricopeptide (TPR) repeat protein
MIEASEIDLAHTLTDGEIAVNNLESARRHSWSRFWRDPIRPGIAECLVEQEQLTAQFLGDLTALDRLETLVYHLDRLEAESPRTSLIQAKVASMAHRFADARSYLAKAQGYNELSDAVNLLSLNLDQACGTELEAVLQTRRRMAAESGRLEDLVPLGALHADLREFDEADRIYRQALREYQDTSPFAVTWVCFQLGALWGELVPETQSDRAAYWYRKAIEYVPCYVKARIHLSEIYLKQGRLTDAEDLLLPAFSSGDPEVSRRLADVMLAMRRFAHADALRKTARSGFDALLRKHLLAFADHGAEFYAGTGDDPARAFELATINLMNRPTLQAFEQAHATAMAADEMQEAFEILVAAEKRWGGSSAFGLSPLAALIGAKRQTGEHYGD